MPRRRNCFSTISARWGAQSLLSSMRDRRAVLFPSPGFQDFFHLREREVALVLAIEKMGREAHARFGAVVHKNFAREQFSANFVGVRAIDGNGSSTLCRILRRIDVPAAPFRSIDEARSHAQRLLANGLDSDLIQNVEAGPARKKRRNVRRAVEIAIRIFSWIDRAGLKSKRAAMCDPARKRRFQRCAQILADVKISNSGAAAEPFEHAANGEICAEGANVHGDSSRGLEGVENDMCADAVGTLDDGARVDDERTAKQNEGNRDQ